MWKTHENPPLVDQFPISFQPHGFPNVRASATLGTASRISTKAWGGVRRIVSSGTQNVERFFTREKDQDHYITIVML